MHGFFLGEGDDIMGVGGARGMKSCNRATICIVRSDIV